MCEFRFKDEIELKSHMNVHVKDATEVMNEDLRKDIVYAKGEVLI